MANTYVKIETYTLSANQAGIEFTNIPQIYTDLLLKVSLKDNRTDSPVTDTLFTLNNSGAGYSMKGMFSNSTGSTVGVFNSSNAAYLSGTYHNTQQSGMDYLFSNAEYYIQNYTSSNHKIIHIEGTTEKNSATDIYMSVIGGVWANTSAVTSVKVVPMYSLSYVQHSSATLYGILKGSGGATVTP